MKNLEKLREEYQSALKDGITKATSLWSYAIEQNHHQAVLEAELTADEIKDKNKDGQNLIDLAIQYNRVEIVDHFTNSFTNLLLLDPLSIAVRAAKYGHINLIEWYLSRFASQSVAVQDDIFSAAASSNQFGLMEYLFARNIYTTAISSRDSTYSELLNRYNWFIERGIINNESPFHNIIGIVGLSLTSLDVLLHVGFDINSHLSKITNRAIRSQSVEIFQWLLEHNFINASNAMALFMRAAEEENLELMDWFYSKELIELSKEDLKSLIEDSRFKINSIVWLINHGWGIEERFFYQPITYPEQYGSSPFRVSITERSQSVEIFQWLLEHNFIDANNAMALFMRATAEENLELMDWFYSKGLINLSEENLRSLIQNSLFKINSIVWLISHGGVIEKEFFYRLFIYLEQYGSLPFRISIAEYYSKLFNALSFYGHLQEIDFSDVVTYTSERNFSFNIKAIGIIIIAELIKNRYDISNLDKEVISNLISYLISPMGNHHESSIGVNLNTLIDLIRSYNPDSSGMEIQSSPAAAVTTTAQNIDLIDSSKNSGSGIQAPPASSTLTLHPNPCYEYSSSYESLESDTDLYQPIFQTQFNLDLFEMEIQSSTNDTEQDIDLTKEVIVSNIGAAVLIGLIMLSESLF